MGVDKSKIGELKESFRKAEAKEEKHKIKEKEKAWKVLAKYFVHGLGFSILFSILVIAWVLVSALLMAIGSLIGLIISLVFLMFIVGGLNIVLMTQVWNVSMPMQTGFWNTLFHGTVLFIVLMILGVFLMMPEMVAPSIITKATMFIMGSFIRGFVAKKIGEELGWKVEEKEEVW